MAEYVDKVMDPYLAAELGLIDDIIEPQDTRKVLIQSLVAMRSKREDLPKRKHGNSPL